MYRLKSLTLINFLSHKYTKFQFREGKAVLVIGQNLDNEGQKGNGSGKSGLNEGISVAIIGSSIRDVKTRELVRRGENSSVVELEMYNTMYRSNVVIRRTLHSSSTKSSECKIWENVDVRTEDNAIKTCADINAYNKYILDLLGISKDDFYNFYLITKEQYKPFLSVGDTKKKEVINRFSGADSVDKTDGLIAKDVKSKESEIASLEKEIAGQESRTKVLDEQIKQEQTSTSDETLEAKKAEYNRDIQIYTNERDVISTTINNLSLEIKQQEAELQSIPVVNSKEEIEGYELQKTETYNSKAQKEQESKDIVKLFQKEIDEVKETETECNDLISKEKENKKLLVTEKEGLENKIQGAINCPKCSHEFTLRYPGFDVEEARKRVAQLVVLIKECETKIGEVEEIIKELDTQKQDINTRIIEKRKTILEEIEGLEKVITSLNSQISSAKRKEQEYKDLVQRKQGSINSLNFSLKQEQQKDSLLDTKIQGLLKSIENLSVKDPSKLQSLKKQFEESLEKEAALAESYTRLVKEKQEIEAWNINFKNFKSHLANQSIKNISDYTNLFLQSIGSNITIKVEGYRLLSSNKLKEEITTLVYKDGFEEGSYGSFSAGERGRIEVCCILALQELINLNTPSGGLDLLVCDEILDSVDTMGLELLINSLQPLGKTVMIVSQNEINTLSENTILIQKEGKVSRIV